LSALHDTLADWDTKGHISASLPTAANMLRYALFDRQTIDLTPRQYAIIRRRALAQSYDVIAHELGIAPSTVKVHIDKAYTRLGVNTLIEALLTLGWLVVPDA
jgi:DNA-binding NarL/FixJ family response regulator